jgi:hypothetical protein
MPLSYPVPWDLVFGLTRHIYEGTRRDVDDFTAAIVARMQPPPEYHGLENIPADPRFLLVANHYQRKGLWILHPAAAITQAVRRVVGPGNPPVHWIVTANWPPIRIGPWRVASPGDRLLPRVAHALHCYAVSFAKHNPGFTAASLRRLLKDAPNLARPIGLFPEGVAGVAGKLTDPLPGVARLIVKFGRPAVPVAISETDRLVIQFGAPVPHAELLAAPDAARWLLSRVGALLTPARETPA